MTATKFRPGLPGLLAGAAVTLGMALALGVSPAMAACKSGHDLDGIRAPQDCLSATDGESIRVRLFRADIAVAALTCNRQQDYNRVVTRHRDELVGEGKNLRALFDRLHQRRAKRELNSFVTHLTNRASMRSLGAPGYCGGMARVFEEALALPAQGLKRYVRRRPVRTALENHTPVGNGSLALVPRRRPAQEFAD